MMRSRLTAGAVTAAALAALLGAGRLPAAELTDATFDKLRDQIRPSAQEFSWREEIPWQLSLGEAVAAAKRQGKPVMLLTTAGQALGHC
jgi:hypothetical protein